MHFQQLIDRNEIVDTVNQIAVNVDRRNWQGVIDCFADEVLLDYRAMVGEEPAKLKPEEIARAWRGLLTGFEMTQHTVTNHKVTIKDNKAEVFSYVSAVHYLPNELGKDTGTVIGYYNHHLMKTSAGWKVDQMKFTPTLIEGNMDLPGLARWAAKRVGTEDNVGGLHASRKEVTFESEGSTLKGHLYIPEKYKGGERLPALIVGGSWTTVKEQMAGLYARRLAKKGFVTLAFDHRGHGESDGEPRNYESPCQKIEDFRNAISFLRSLSIVDGERIGALGVCASAGYLAQVAAEDERLKAFVTVAAWFHESETVLAVYGGEEGVRIRIEAGAAARKKFEETGEVDYVPAYSKTDPSAAMYGNFDYYSNPTRGAIPEWDNQFAVMSWPEWLKFNPVLVAEQIKTPTLIIHSHDSALPQGARRFFENLKGPKALYWTEGTHFDFYDQEAYVDEAVYHAAIYFDKYLRSK
jgi:fermentation-respiration switch protein FrsA (DUF1100 family)